MVVIKNVVSFYHILISETLKSSKNALYDAETYFILFQINMFNKAFLKLVYVPQCKLEVNVL